MGKPHKGCIASSLWTLRVRSATELLKILQPPQLGLITMRSQIGKSGIPRSAPTLCTSLNRKPLYAFGIGGEDARQRGWGIFVLH